MHKYICKYNNFLNESIFKNYFIIKDPKTGELYSVPVPDKNVHDIIRMERPNEKFLRILSSIKDSVKLNTKRLLSHGNDNKLATELFVKWVVYKNITPSEYEFIKNTAIGNLKLLGVGSAEIFMPGSSVTLPMILIAAGKNDINLFPDAWNKIKKEHKNYNLKKLSYNKKSTKLQQDIARYSGEIPLEKTKEQKKLEAIIKKIDSKNDINI